MNIKQILVFITSMLGLLGSVVLWKYFEVDGPIAGIVALFSFMMLCYSLSEEIK